MPRPAETSAERPGSPRPKPPRWRRLAVLLLLGLAGIAGALGIRRAADLDPVLDAVAARVEAATGLRVTRGAARLHIGAPLGVEIQGVTLTETGSAGPLLVAERVRVGIELAPLLAKRVVLDSIVVVRPLLCVRRGPDGRWNVDAIAERVKQALGSPSEEGAGSDPASGLEKVIVEGGRIDWRDALARDSALASATLEPVELELRPSGGPHEVTVSARAELAAASLPAQAKSRAHLAVTGRAIGAREGNAWDDARLEMDASLEGLALAWIDPFLPASLGADAGVKGIADLKLRFEGAPRGDYTANLELVAKQLSWNAPAAWPHPVTQKQLALKGRVTREADTLRIDELALDGDGAHVTGHAVLADLRSGDPELTAELATPWLELTQIEPLLPLGRMQRVFTHIVRAVEGGRGRAEHVRVKGRLSQIENRRLPENLDVFHARLLFEDVHGPPHPGLAVAKNVTGTVVLERGSLALDGFSAHYGNSNLKHLDGAVRDVWAGAKLRLELEDGDVDLRDLRDLLASEVLPERARQVAGGVEVKRGRGTFGAVVEYTPGSPIQFSGRGDLAGSELRLRSRDAAVQSLRGPVVFDRSRIASDELAFAVNASRLTVSGSISEYLTKPRLDLTMRSDDLAAADLYDALGAKRAAGAGAPSGRLRGTTRIRGLLHARPAISADLRLERFDLGPPLIGQRLGDVTGHLVLDEPRSKLDRVELTWHGHRLRVVGTIEHVTSKTPFIDVEAEALEPLDIEAFIAGAGASTGSSARSSRGGGGSDITVDGRLVAPQARYRETAIEGLSARFRFEPGVVRLTSVEGQALGGSFAVGGRVDLERGGPAKVSIEPKLTGVDAAGLLKAIEVPWAALAGRGDVSGRVELTWPARQHLDSIAGELSVGFRDGQIASAGALWKILDLVDFSRWTTSSTEWRQAGLEYRELQAMLRFGNGLLATEDLALRGPSVDLRVAGNLRLVDRTVDAVVTVSPFQLLDDALDPIPVIGALKNGLSLTAYAFHLDGPLADPRVVPEAFDRVDEAIDRMFPGRKRDERRGGAGESTRP